MRSDLQLRAAPPAGFDRHLLPPLILGAVLNPVNSTIIAVALIPIGRALGAPPSQTVWLVSALYVATAIGQPVVGRLIDVYGPRPLYLGSTGLAGIAGLLGTFAPDLPVLVVARVLLGFATCAGYPAAMYLVRREADRTGQDSPSGVLTVLAVSSQTIQVIGPTLGGALIATGGWRASFAVNVPLSLLCLLLGARALPRVRPAGAGAPASIDPVGIGLFAVTLVSLLVFLDRPQPAELYLPVIAVVAIAGFVWWERRRSVPFVDVRVLGGNRPLVLTYGRAFLAQTVAYFFLYGFPQWLEDGRGLSATATGLLLLPLSGAALVVSSLTGRNPRVRGKLVLGALLQIVFCALLLVLGVHSAVWLLIVVSALAGLPQGLNSLANQNALYHQADPVRTASSAGLLRTASYLGAIAASAATGLVFGAGATTSGLHAAAIVMLAVAGVFLLVTLTDRSLARIGRPS